MSMLDAISGAINMRRDSEAVKDIVKKMAGDEETEFKVMKDNNEMFAEVKRAGTAFCFKMEGSVMVLSSLWVYSEGVDGFAGHAPGSGLLLSGTAKEIVQTYGEPSKKGGGGSSPIWIEYSNFKGTHLRALIEFQTTSWEDPAVPVRLVSYFS